MKVTAVFVLWVVCLAPQIYAQEIETITVTANRQQQDIDQIDRSVYEVGNRQIENIGAQHINQTLVRIPGAWISRGNGQEHLTAIRSPVLTGAGGCGAFFVAQDGIASRAPGFCNANQLFDLNTEQAHRIEVLNGPASVSYGSNAVHGVINVISPSAIEDGTTYWGVDAGPHQYIRTKFSLSNRSKDRGILLYGNLSDDGGYQASSGYQQQKLNGIYQQKFGLWEVKTVAAYTNLNQQTAGFVQGYKAYADPALRTTNPNPDAYRKARSARLYSQFKYTNEKQSTLTFTPYLRWADMNFSQHYLPWQSAESNRQKSVGIQSQFTQQFNDISLTTGFDADLTQGDLQEFQAAEFSPTIPQGFHYNYTVDSRVLSPFVSAAYVVNDRLTLRAGARYEHTQYDYQNHLTDGSGCEELIENCRFSRPPDQKVNFSQWSYEAGLHYLATPHNSLYLQFSRGHRAPQATELFRLQGNQQIADLDVELLDALEVGLKGDAGNLSYQLSAFLMTKQNFIFQDTLKQNISNGETRHHGSEASLRYNFTPSWYAALNASYSEHRYDNNLTISRQPINNNLIDTAPLWLGSAQLGWRGQSGQWVELEWIYQDKYFLDPENTATYAGHKLVNLRAGFEVLPQLQFYGRITNLLDTDYAERADYSFGNYRYFIGQPRGIYVGMKWTWDEE